MRVAHIQGQKRCRVSKYSLATILCSGPEED